MSLRFGTDGIRGVALEELTLELSFALGRAAASVFPGTIAVGRDTRQSGSAIQQALTDGLGSAGARVIDLGVLPTPGIAYAGATLGVAAAVVSASHNPFGDNGIKFFAPGGRKLQADEERAVEAAIDLNAERSDAVVADDGSDFASSYEQHLQMVTGPNCEGLSIVVDCANGAASYLAERVFTASACDVTAINASPNGRNINSDCGSTHPQSLQEAVVSLGADIGLALDGDADRVLAVDENGTLVDGDEMMGMLAIDGKQSGWLKDDTLVLTVMSNLGLRQSMRANGINVHETSVGDKYVLDALSKNGWTLGGEQSGHIILPQHATTGDGMLTGLVLLDLMKRSDKPLSELAAQAMQKLPQVLLNVRVVDMAGLKNNEVIGTAVRQAQHALGGEGRVLLRPSGTEPLVRVMVEAPTAEHATEVASGLIDVVVGQLGRAS